MSYGKRITWLEDQALIKEAIISQKQTNSKIVLFDLDGTLTPPRQSFDISLLPVLRELGNKADIGIVSGSDFDYIKEQLSYLMKKTELRYKLHILPCNGTKYYKPPSTPTEDFCLIYESDMKKFLGEEHFFLLMKILSSMQSHIAELHIPLCGNFIQYRDSMINWCPIGRKASLKEREIFKEKDSSLKIREEYLRRLNRKFKLSDLDKKIVCALGGDTSFDIYPTGWDKTYSLKHFTGREVWFVGDRCDEGGNDKALYDFLKKGNAYKTKNPQHTIKIIKNEIFPRL